MAPMFVCNIELRNFSLFDWSCEGSSYIKGVSVAWFLLAISVLHLISAVAIKTNLLIAVLLDRSA